MALKYPQKKLEESDDWFSISIYEYKPGGAATGSGSSPFSPSPQGKGSLIETIILPMPQNLPGNTLSADWTGSTMNALAAATGGVASATVGGGAEGLMKSLSSVVNSATSTLQTGSTINTIQEGIANEAVKALLGENAPSTAQVLSRTRGIAFNQNVELTFNGIDLRGSHMFNFNLAPRNKRESDVIKAIIKTLKQNMSPARNAATSASGIFLSAPNLFEIEYKKGKAAHPFLNKFKLCALKGLSLDLSPEGYATYNDATPVTMTLSLEFQELTPIYREDYAEDTSTSISY
jgi:hypothetical protein